MAEFHQVGETIYKATNTIPEDDIDHVAQILLANTNHDLEDINSVPWFQGNNKNNVLYYVDVNDRRGWDILNTYRAQMEQEIEQAFGEPVYTHLTTLVLWKPGQSMPRHVDNGSDQIDENTKEMLRIRKYTSVTYLNDDYVGGETYLRNGDEDFISVPTKGATILFYGDDRNAHGVNKLESGTRMILSCWFVTDPQHKEPII